MQYGLIKVEDNIRVERDKIDSLKYSKQTGKDVENKYRVFPWLGRSVKKKDADNKKKDGTKRSNYEDYGQEMVKRNDTIGVKWGYEGMLSSCKDSKWEVSEEKGMWEEQASLN